MDTLEFLAQTSASMKADGKFYSSKDAKAAGRNSTGDDAAFALQDGQADYTEEDMALATEALTWIRSYEGDNRFLKMLRTKVALDTMLFSNAALAAFVIPNYLKDSKGEQPEADLAEYADSDFYGAKGDELVAKVKIVSNRMTGTRYGQKPIIHFVNDAGCLFNYWPSAARPELAVGSEFRVVAVVKGHQSYKGLKQTTIKGKPKFFKV